jgi:hypothetical protein
MTLETKKKYLLQLACNGIDFDTASGMVFLSDSDRKLLEKDKKFFDDYQKYLLELALRYTRDYNDKVMASENPKDALDRLNRMFRIMEDKSVSKTDITISDDTRQKLKEIFKA